MADRKRKPKAEPPVPTTSEEELAAPTIPEYVVRGNHDDGFEWVALRDGEIVEQHTGFETARAAVESAHAHGPQVLMDPEVEEHTIVMEADDSVEREAALAQVPSGPRTSDLMAERLAAYGGGA